MTSLDSLTRYDLWLNSHGDDHMKPRKDGQYLDYPAVVELVKHLEREIEEAREQGWRSAHVRDVLDMD